MSSNHINQQVLIAGHLLDMKQWSSLAVSLARDYTRESQALFDLFEDNKPVRRDRVESFLITCELLHRLQPGFWSFNDKVVISEEGKASLAVNYPNIV